MSASDESRRLSIEEIFLWARKEAVKDRSEQSAISHAIANRFMSELTKEGVPILETGKGNSNYFLVEVDGNVWGISPFGSQKGWWDKPSDGFRSAINARSCKWGVVLFRCKSKWQGVWIPGSDFDAHILKGKETVNAPDVNVAISNGVAKIFHEPAELLLLLRKPPEEKGKHFLLPKSR